MSVKLMAQVWELDLPHAQLLVGLALADHGKDDGSSIYPSVAHTAWKCGYSDRQTQRIVHQLVERGLLIKVADASDHRPVEYRMDTAAVTPKPPQRDRGDKMSPHQNDAPGVTSATDRGDTAMSPEPSIEPSGNESSNEDSHAASPHDEDIIRLCKLMSDETRQQRNIPPGSRQYRVNDAWLRACRQLIETDGYSVAQIEFVIGWVRGHHYWRHRILSMTRLRGEMPVIAADLKRQREQREHLGAAVSNLNREQRARAERSARRMRHLSDVTNPNPNGGQNGNTERPALPERAGTGA